MSTISYYLESLFENLRLSIEMVFPYVIENIFGLTVIENQFMVFVVVSFVSTTLLSLFIPVPLVFIATILFVPFHISFPALVIAVYCSSFIGALFGAEEILTVSTRIISVIRRRLGEYELSDRRISTVVSVALLRHLPIAPYGLVNIALGQLGASPYYVSLGSIIGLLPNLLLLGFGKSYLLY